MKKPIFFSFILGASITFSPSSMASLLQHHLSTTNDKNALSSIEFNISNVLEEVNTLEQHLSSAGDKESSTSITRVVSQPQSQESDIYQDLIKFHIENL